MRNLKRILSLILTASILGACSAAPTTASKQGGLIYTTFYPVYDLTKRIVGDKMEVKMLIKANEEPHSFELKAIDRAALHDADLVVYNGANMENFIPDLRASLKDDKKFLNLSQGLTLLENKSDLDDGEHNSVNPHTWLSVKNAMEQLYTIYERMAVIDPANEKYYKTNLDKSLAEFSELDKKFTETIGKISKKEKYFVVSHAAFNYLAKDYGLKQVAVTGISPEDEPTAAQLKKIADFVKSNGIKTILFEGKTTPKVAETLARETGTKTDTIYTLENLTEEEAKMGYIHLMEHNLQTLAKVLSE
ncbi:metal ABC transporter substrate-binding protein [Amygdalobacter nucleatus]|uniref:ABC transporter, substrate-binding protein n=1 Tax=Amygdalobacter nucleatus TaxID=3029274 RepID=A0A133Y7W7_9FIRM|nr:zinc ABC transporter substrate-binding protein [Amygdalobacter nucleatus]KXB39195.1 ABC transporter, substrate-binding protein [Amygdalobacter nucleatus]MDF0485477.1 zinc ABC transporter substrate-binding protein [Amygdalobacter nucleatus]